MYIVHQTNCMKVVAKDGVGAADCDKETVYTVQTLLALIKYAFCWSVCLRYIFCKKFLKIIISLGVLCLEGKGLNTLC